MQRKVWTIPDRVFDILDNFPEAVEIEVIRMIRAYHRQFDQYGSDEGFDCSSASPAAQSVFWRVYDELHDADVRYMQKCAVLAENAAKGVEKKQKKKERKEKKKEWYRANAEKINAQRRKKSGKVIPQKEKEKVSSDLDGVSSGLSSGCPQALENQGEQKMPANRNRIIGLNNIPSLRSGILLEGGIGGKPSYPQGGENGLDPRVKPKDDRFMSVDKQSGSNRTSGLSCSKAVQPASSSPFAAVRAVRTTEAVGKRRQLRQFEQFGIRAQWQSGRAAVEADAAVSAPPGKPSAGSARKDYADGARGLLSAPHSPREGEVLITKNFAIDFDDPVFKPYFRADKFLRRALNDWLVKNKIGCSVEKRWIAGQLVKFAQRQGKLNVLMGVE